MVRPRWRKPTKYEANLRNAADNNDDENEENHGYYRGNDRR